MNKEKISNENGQKSKIGFAHGFTCIIGGIILAYLSLMLFSKYMPGDNAIKIMPSVISTPILISIFGLWLLFSKSLISSLIKLLSLGIVLFLIFKVL